MRPTHRYRAKVWISAVVLATNIVGCTRTQPAVFRDDMPHMATIHAQTFATKPAPLREPTRPIADDGPTTDTPWLPNPTLRLYVFPHLTAGGLPVPGYTTVFRLYSQDHVAAPGERGGWSSTPRAEQPTHRPRTDQ